MSSGHIVRRLVVAVVLAALLLNAVLAVPAYLRWHKLFIDDLRAEATEVVRGAIDPDRFPTLRELARTGEHLVRSTDIEGGIWVTGIGEERASFGEAPELSWADARLHDETWRLSPDKGTFELFLSQEITGVSYGLLVRADARPAWQRTLYRLGELALLALIAVSALAVATAAIARRMVSDPLAAIHEAVETALNDPDGFASDLSQVSRCDETGRLSLALDQLLIFLRAQIDERRAADSLIERIQHGVLIFSAHGHLLDANRAALRLFDAPDVASLREREGGCGFHFNGEWTTAPNLLEDGAAFGPGEIGDPQTGTPCLVAGDVIHGTEGAPERYFAIFVDMSRAVSDMRHQVALRQKAEREKRRSDEELARLRRRFEACLVLLEHDDDDVPRARPVTVDPAKVIQHWLEKAVERGVMQADGVRHEDLPALLGDPKEMRRLFEALLDAVRLRSSEDRPSLVVTAEVAEKQANFTVYSTDPSGQHPVGMISAREDVSLFLAAAGRLARREEGELIATSMAESGNAIAVKLPLDQAFLETRAEEADTAAA